MPAPLRPLVVAIAVLAVAACGGRAGRDGVAYGPPDPDPATYTFADTARFTIEAGLGPMTVTTTQEGVAELDFRRWRTDGSVIVRFPRYRGTFRNPTQGAATADASDIGGPFTVDVTATGRVAVIDTPSLSDAVLDIAGPESLVRPLFVQLPGGPVEAGAHWVDTVVTVEEAPGTRSEARRVITSTLDGDTVVAGRRLLRIRVESANTVRVTGVSGGVEIEQRLSGATTGTVLWDRAARLLVERVSVGQLTGTLELPEVNVPPMAVRASFHRVVSLRP